MIKKLLLLVLVLGLIGAAFGIYQYNKPAAKTVRGTADYVVNAADLFAEFEQNEEAANQKFLNQVLQVNGRIADIGAPDAQGVTLTLATNHALFGVSCQITDAADVASLKVGDQVQVKGLCTGMLMDVVLTKCSIEKP